MDRLHQLRGDAGDSTLDTSSPPSEAFMSANESSSKYFSLSEVDSTFSISPSKDAPATAADSERTIAEESAIIPNLSPIPKTDIETFKIGKHIEAANILSGGVNIFDDNDNDNSYDGDELVIDDNVVLDDEKVELKLSEDAASPLEKTTGETLTEGLEDVEAIPSKDTEVVLQIDGKSVDAIDIGNRLYLYRKAGENELSAVQIIEDDQQQPSYKFLKVRENTEGNLEVYEEIQIEIPKEEPTKDGGFAKEAPHVPINDINKVINEPLCNKVIDKVDKAPNIESNSIFAPCEPVETHSESKSEVNLNGKMMKIRESRKSPLTFTPMTYHSTPKKEGIPLTKTMVDQQLHPSRHSDNIKKTIEVHTDYSKPKIIEASIKPKEVNESTKPQKQESLVEEAEKDSRQVTIAEHRQPETAKKEFSGDLKCEAYNDEYNKDSIEIKHVLESKECVAVTSEETEMIIEEKKLYENVSSQSLTVTNAVKGSKETSQNPVKRTEDNQNTTVQPLIKKNIDDNNSRKDSEIKSDNIIYQRETESEDQSKTKPTDNVIVSSTTVIIEDKQVDLTNEITESNKLEKGLHSKPNEKDGIIPQLIDAVTEQAFTTQSKLTPLAKIKTNTVIEAENITVPETQKDVADMCSTTKKTVTDLNTINNIADDVGKSDKDKIENINISLLIDKEKTKECDKANSIEKDNGVSKLVDLPVKCSADSQIVNVICTKDMNVNVRDESIKSEANETALSLAPTQKDNPEFSTVNKGDVKCFKLISKDTNPTKTKLPEQIKLVDARKEPPNTKTITNPNKSNSAVPFGKWTEANRQEFLNKIKETKIPSNNSNTNQIKQTNDLNRRDVLKKFDSQRQSTVTAPTKIPDFSSVPKFSKMESAAFVNKSAVIQKTNSVKPVIPPVKTQTAQINPKPAVIKKPLEEEGKEMVEQRIIINSQELIDSTIEGIITRALKIKTTTPVHMKEKMTIHTVENPKDATPLPGSLDDIEMKMNELHGFSFMERSAQELCQATNHESKPHNKPEDMNVSKNNIVPNLLPYKIKEQQKSVNETMRDDTSDEEIIEHEPITGDIDASKQSLISLLSCKEKFSEPKKDAIITENEFDKFARRNSITYEKCLTVKIDNKEKHNVIKTVVEKDTRVKKLSRNELLLAESKAKSSSKQHTAARHNNQASKIPTLKVTSEDDSFNKNYQSRVQIAYQTALTAKRNLECPITMIEDKPVKVVFMDTNAEYSPIQLNVQGQELSPSKNQKADSDVHSASELDSTQDTKPQDEKSKTKHQRKQVFTPVEQEPEMQLIEPSDLGIKVSPTKKRKTEEKSDKNIKNLVPKKSYLLNRNVVDEHRPNSDTPKTEAFTGHNVNTAIDNLVKAAELIENQSESNGTGTTVTSPATDTPVKRGRGRPRKYPLPEPGSEIIKPPSPQKKPRLIDAKPAKVYSDSEESSDGEIVQENWTVGKINENIVCPICSKLFRSEDVLFKHVKHCTGPSPNRSDSDKRSPRRLRDSQESGRKVSDSRSEDTDNVTDMEEEKDTEDKKIKRRHNDLKPENDIEEVIVIEDTPVKQKPTDEKVKHREGKKNRRKAKLLHNPNLVCEFCGKTFRQLSYLNNHKLQHKNEDQETKHLESDTTEDSVLCCDVCDKQFRKLHHLVQHRLIHNPSQAVTRPLRKTSTEVHDAKSSKTPNDDTSAGFRCEPCDKSFRKLHHLVEHRETHDGINKKGNIVATQVTTETSKSDPMHHCDVCKKVFKELQDLIEHKEQHYETSSEKSDDKSVKSSLSSKDIIHECSLCYMVFPNEHSLTKHTVICLRKKKQSAAKQAAKQVEGEETPDAENGKSEEDVSQDIQTMKDTHESVESEVKVISANDVEITQAEQVKDKEEKIANEQLEDNKHTLDVKPRIDIVPKKRHSIASEKTDDIETPAKIKKVEDKDLVIIVETPTPKKKTNKAKVASTVTKRQKTVNCPLPVIDNVKPKESSDDEIRYMLNPNFKEQEGTESKAFMKISALKRSSLQFERPTSKNLLKRRISLPHAPKMPRLKVKPIESKPKLDQERSKLMAEKKLAPVTETTTDSDDSDVKYSFPEQESQSVERKAKRQSMGVKRKSLVGIAKRKSLGKPVAPIGKPKRRTAEAEHRCDCGQLFSSAALLSRHTSLSHTPPRIRRRRSPPPETQSTKPAITKPTITKHAITKTTNTKPINKKPKPDVTNSNKTIGVATRKSSVSNISNSEVKSDSGKSVKSDSFKTLRSAKSVSDKSKKLEKKK